MHVTILENTINCSDISREIEDCKLVNFSIFRIKKLLSLTLVHAHWLPHFWKICSNEPTSPTNRTLFSDAVCLADMQKLGKTRGKLFSQFAFSLCSKTIFRATDVEKQDFETR